MRRVKNSKIRILSLTNDNYIRYFTINMSIVLFSRIIKLGQLTRCYDQTRFCKTPSQVTDDEKEKELERIAKNASIDEPPTACCQSGCANCVFIVWAEALSAKMQDAGPEITEKILKMVDDPSLKAYLEMELRLRGLKK